MNSSCIVDQRTVQTHLDALGFTSFRVTVVEPAQGDIRALLRRRYVHLHDRFDSPMRRTVIAALPRLNEVKETDTVYRWEAESDLGRIVGFSTAQALVAILPWIMRERNWVASVTRF